MAAADEQASIDLWAPQPDWPRFRPSTSAHHEESPPALGLPPHQPPRLTAPVRPLTGSGIARHSRTKTSDCQCCYYRCCGCAFCTPPCPLAKGPLTSATSTAATGDFYEENQSRDDLDLDLDLDLARARALDDKVISFEFPRHSGACNINTRQAFRNDRNNNDNNYYYHWPISQSESRKEQFRLRRWPTLDYSVSFDECDFLCCDSSLSAQHKTCDKGLDSCVDSEGLVPPRRDSVVLVPNFDNVFSSRITHLAASLSQESVFKRECEEGVSVLEKYSASCPSLTTQTCSTLHSSQGWAITDPFDSNRYPWAEATQKQRKHWDWFQTKHCACANTHSPLYCNSFENDGDDTIVRNALEKDLAPYFRNRNQELHYTNPVRSDTLHFLDQDPTCILNNHCEARETTSDHRDSNTLKKNPCGLVSDHLDFEQNDDLSVEAFDDFQTDSAMRRSSSEGRTRVKTRFDVDMDHSYTDKRYSDSEGSDIHSQSSRSRTVSSRSNVTRSKKSNLAPTGSPNIPVKQKTVKIRQTKLPTPKETPGPQRKSQQRRILPTVGSSQVSSRNNNTNNNNNANIKKANAAKKAPLTKSLTMTDIDGKAELSHKSQNGDLHSNQFGQNNGTTEGEPVSNLTEVSQRRSIMKVMRRPTEVSDSHIFTMKPSDVLLNKGVWTEAKQAEDEDEVEEETISPMVNFKAPAPPAVPPRTSVRPKSMDQAYEEQTDASDSTGADLISYAVEEQPGSVTTSAVIHLARGSEETYVKTEAGASSVLNSAPSSNSILDAEDDTRNNSVDANSPETVSPTDIGVSPPTPSKSQSEPLLNTDTNEADKTNSSFRRPRDTTRTAFSGSEDILSDSYHPARTYKSAPTTPAQTHPPSLFQRSPAGSEGNSSGGSTSLPSWVPWSRETLTSRKRYEIAHCEHDHFLAMNAYSKELRLDRSPRSARRSHHAHEHHHCNHSNGCVDMEHFRTDHHCNRDHGKVDTNIPGPYLTPRQRLEKETRMLKREVSKLIRVNEQKEAEIFALKCQVDGERNIQDNEKDEQIVQLTEKLGRNEKERFVDKEALCKVQEELSDMSDKYLDLQRQMAEQKAKYDEYLLGMYKKGQEAARFEREQELDYLLANVKNAKKAGVSLTELSRKLFRTEEELARWQALRLAESYNSPQAGGGPAAPPNSQVLKIRNNHHSLLDPTAASEADVTLAFVRDAFFHLLTDPVDREQHVRALLKIFAYPEAHLHRIKLGLEAFKNIKIKKVFADA